MKTLGDLIQSLDQTSNEDELWQAIFQGFESLGCETTIFLYGSHTHRFARSNMQREFSEYYQKENLTRVDPFIHHSLKNPLPMPTGKHFLDYYPSATQAQRDFAHLVGETGFKAGLSIPLASAPAHGFGGWNLGGDLSRKETVKIITEKQKDIQLFAHYAFHCLVEQRQQGIQALSAREYDCLTYAALGWSNQAIADQLQLTNSTIEFHFRSIRKKLNATNRAHSIALAVRYRLIDPMF